MIPGDIVLVDWRDALPGSGEPNKRRPAVVVSAPRFFTGVLPFEIVVPLTGERDLAIVGASLEIAPNTENGCAKTCYALAWAVQSVPHARITQTSARITGEQLHRLRRKITDCLDHACSG